MKTNRLFTNMLLFLIISIIASFNFFCKKEIFRKSHEAEHSTVTTSSANYITSKKAQSGYIFLIGVDSLESPVVASAATGERISLVGSGTLSIHPKSATGSGEYIINDKNGAVYDSGSWVVDDLVTFVPYGNSTPDFPEELEGGKAFFRIRLTPDSGSETVDAILKIYCELGKAPKGTDEGMRLVAPGFRNFNKQVSGETVFVRQ